MSQATLQEILDPILRLPAEDRLRLDELLTQNDTDLLTLSPFEGLRILSMSDYLTFLQDQGLLG